VENVGGGIGQDPATEVTHVGLNQSPVFSSLRYTIWLWKAIYSGKMQVTQPICILLNCS